MFGLEVRFCALHEKTDIPGMSVRTVSISHSSMLVVHLKNIFFSVTVAYNAGSVA